MSDYTSSYTGTQMDTLLGKVSDIESAVSTLSTEVSALDSAVTDKVDKVAGKGLSENDYTNGEKAKLAALPTNSELNTTLNGKASASSVSNIEAKIPAEASSSNKLADKEFVTTRLVSKADNSTVNAIAAKIPSEASSSNQLADKAYVSSSLSGKASTASVSAIEAKIPSAASSSNQLADKAYVASAISAAGDNSAVLGTVIENNVSVG